jgi:hypothetical protein
MTRQNIIELLNKAETQLDLSTTDYKDLSNEVLVKNLTVYLVGTLQMLEIENKFIKELEVAHASHQEASDILIVTTRLMYGRMWFAGAFWATIASAIGWTIATWVF